MKTLTADHKAAMLAGRDARKDAIRSKCESQTIVIDEIWSIRRVDERNWQIINKNAEKNGFDNENFHGSLFAALRALPAKMLSSEACGTLQLIIDNQKAIRSRIVQAVLAIEKYQQ